VRRLAWLLLLLLLAGALAVWLFNRLVGGPGLQDAPPPNPPSGAQVLRGAYLARAGNCVLCHTERGGTPLAGGRAIETPFGTVFSSNLTPDAETGIGRWNAGHFWRALHFGRSRDGRLLYPAFPYNHFTRITRADSDALFDYLRSQPAARRPNREHDLQWPYRTQVALAVWRTLYFRPGVHQDERGRSAEWNRGAYLVQGLGHCGACHTTRNALGAVSEGMDLSGGTIPMQNWYAPSLTSRSEASVHDWPMEDVVDLLQAGASPRGTVLGPMADVVLHSTQHLEAADLRAMAIYLKSLPVTPGGADTDPREVPRAPAAVIDRGAAVYKDHCAQCHGSRGEGVPGAYPKLAGNRAVLLPVTSNLVQIVLYGGFPPSTRLNPRPFGMPPYAVTLSDAEVAAVLSYLRASWGNRAAPVTELDVARQRGTTQ
jgi:mono/diheme cytochrome c family protein